MENVNDADRKIGNLMRFNVIQSTVLIRKRFVENMHMCEINLLNTTNSEIKMFL